MIIKCTGYSRGMRRAVPRARRHLGYLVRDGTGPRGRASLYDESLRALKKDDVARLKDNLANVRGERRLIISPHPGLHLSEAELLQLATDILNEFRNSTRQRFHYILSVHTNTDVPHVHVLMYSKRFRDIKMYREQMKLLKDIAARYEREAWERRTRRERQMQQVKQLPENTLQLLSSIVSPQRGRSWIENLSRMTRDVFEVER